MKMPLLIGFLQLASLSAYAGVDVCSPSLMQEKRSKAAVEFLQSLPGKFQVGPCTIELHVCEMAAPEAAQSSVGTSKNSVVGDMLITDARGEQFYVVLDLNRNDTKRTSRLVGVWQRTIHYESIERFSDEVNGRSEVYRLELKKTRDLSRIERLELGVYTSNLRGEYPFLDPARSYWAICEG